MDQPAKGKNQDQPAAPAVPQRSTREPGAFPIPDDWCFACGRDNPFGLHLSWKLEEDGTAAAHFHPDRRHQGWSGLVHGGILATLIDESMAQRLRFAGIRALTASLSLRYRHPAPTSGVLIAEARLVGERLRAVQLEAWVRGADGTRYAEGEGTCVRMGPSPES